MSEGHPGFKAVESNIEKKEGVSEKSAGAIVASASRKASPAAKKANPRLNKVKGSSEKSEKYESKPYETMENAHAYMKSKYGKE